MNIAVDAMGGDWGPQAPTQESISFAKKHTGENIYLLGDQEKIKNCVKESIPSNLEIIHTSEAIETGEDPVRAFRSKKKASLILGAEMIKNGKADTFLSAGNTGALVTAGLLCVGRMNGVDRPALAPIIPTFSNAGVLLLDAGATMDATAENLLDYGIMGALYSESVLGKENPTVALLNVGTEENKGNHVVKTAHGLLKNAPLHFVGNVEAREILSGEYDVVVCDGFSGNVVLKLVEGVGAGIFQTLKKELTSNWRSKIGAGILKHSIYRFKKRFDYHQYGAAPFLGVSGGLLKVHGSSQTFTWQLALEQACKFEYGVIEKKVNKMKNMK